MRTAGLGASGLLTGWWRTAHDPVAFGAGLLALSALLTPAAFLHGRRALRIDPIAALLQQ